MTDQEKEDILKEIPGLNWKNQTQINVFKSLMDSYPYDRLKGWLYDLKEDFKHGYIKNPAGVFLYWLETDMGTKEKIKKEKTNTEAIEIYKSQQNIEQIKTELSKQLPDNVSLQLPSRENGVELPKILSDWSFFTLSTNKNEFDKIEVDIQTEAGKTKGILYRGVILKGTKPYGILNAFDGRVFSAIISLWQKKGGYISKIEFNEEGNKKTTGAGSVKIQMKELLAELGLQKSGQNEKSIINSLGNLTSKPYSLYTTDEKLIGSFKLLYGADLSTIRRGRITDKVGIYITLSPQITSQFFNRHSLPFSKNILQNKSELAYILWVYLETVIAARNGKPDKRSLLYLINRLHLPPNKMYNYKSQRKQVFEIAIENLKKIKTAKGKEVYFQWEEDINDWNLIFGYALEFPKELIQKNP